MSRSWLPIASLLVLSACINVGPRSGFPPSTLGDRAAIDLAEVVATVRTEKGPHNLHVWLAILITPNGRVNERELAEVSGVLRRTEGRIAAEITADLTGRAALSTSALGKAREELAGLAQAKLDEAIARWRLRDSFRFEAVITSIYFTDGSVSRTRASERWWSVKDGAGPLR
jgi:hypothetical protein